jgi:hypothetical protein
LTQIDSNTTSAVASAELTGWSGSGDYFQFREYQGYVPAAVLDVLRGNVLGAVFRGVIGPAACAEVADRFWASPAGRQRGGEAPVRYLGAYHYHKGTQVYLDECAEVAAAIEEILRPGNDPLAVFYGGLAESLDPAGITVRRAEYDGRQACRGVLRSWFGRGQFALDPHEDRGQCGVPQQADFEIQQVLQYRICAMNICLENGADGRLRIWNIQPDVDSKRRLGTEYSGSPYPVEPLESIESTWLRIGPGDIYVFNGSHVHAVEPSSGPDVRRTTLSGFLGFADDSTVVSWT